MVPERPLTFPQLTADSTMKISILFLYLRMTPERSHKIAIYVLIGLICAHFISSFIVRRSIFKDLLHRVDANTYVGRNLSMHTDRCLLVFSQYTPEPEML